MKKSVVLFLCLCLVLTAGVRFAQTGRADFGDFSGNSDFGGSDWGGSDWGGSDWGGSDYDWDSGSGGSSDPFGMLVGVIIVVVVYLVFFRNKKGKGAAGQRGAPPVSMPRAQMAPNLIPAEQYTALDPDFDVGAFSTKLSNLYVQMQNAWTAKDIEPMRPYFTDAYWAQMDRQLQAARAAGRTNYVERIAVLSVTPLGYFQSGGSDHMVAQVYARIVDYTLDDRTGKLLSGSRTAEKFMTYQWDLTRPTGSVTRPEGQMSLVNCPNCGAALSINESAKCPYCDSVITLHDHDWAINSIQAVSQRTAG